MIKAILVDPETQTIKTIKFSGNYDDIFNIIGDDDDDIHYDQWKDFFLYYVTQRWIESDKGLIFGGQNFYKGKVLFVGRVTDDSDEINTFHMSCPLSIKFIESVIEFTTQEQECHV